MTRTPKQVAKMRKAVWSPEARAKRKATFAAKRAMKEASGAKPSDALAYLLKAEKILLQGKLKRVGPFETLVFLALNSLRGEL